MIVVLFLFAGFAIIDGPTFYSIDNLRVILSTQTTNGVVALAVVVALIAGEVDLSVGGVMGTAAGVCALLISDGRSPSVAIVAALLLAAVFGLVNGLLITVARLSSIIATLATGTIATGVGLAIVGPGTISGLSPGFLNIFATSWGGVQTSFFILVLLTVVAALVLQRTLLGRRLFFVGQNREAAALLGIRINRLTVGAMANSSLLAGFAGVMLAGQNGSSNVTQTQGYLLPAFAAAFLGTSAILPGRFNAIGAFIATYVLGETTVGLNIAGGASWSSYIFNGGLLIVSLSMFTIIKFRNDHIAKKRSMIESQSALVHVDE